METEIVKKKMARIRAYAKGGYAKNMLKDKTARRINIPPLVGKAP